MSYSNSYKVKSMFLEASIILHLGIYPTNILAYNPRITTNTTSAVSIRTFNNIEDEVRYVLSDIYSEVMLNKELNFSDFSIVLPSLLEYRATIENIIKDYNIPYYIDESEKLLDNYIIRLLFNINEIIKGDYKLYDFSYVLKSPEML